MPDPLDPAVQEALQAYIKLMRASRAVLNRVEKLLSPEGLTITQLGVLDAIFHKGPLTHRELGRKVLSSAGNMTDVVDKLEARRLVRRIRDPLDRRRVTVELTVEGRSLISELFPRHALDIARAMDGLTVAELRDLSSLLRRLGHAAAGQGGGLVDHGATDHIDP